ncbi:MAG: hypothetical protein MI749_14375 [Desulfovibrionales bacterium]|nr:hypothetical protein [Desulfovibrionales bacterium]
MKDLKPKNNVFPLRTAQGVSRPVGTHRPVKQQEVSTEKRPTDATSPEHEDNAGNWTEDECPEEAWHASLTGVESEMVSELLSEIRVQCPYPKITPEEVDCLLHSDGASPKAMVDVPTEVLAELTGGGICDEQAEESVFGLPVAQLAEAQKNGTLTQLLEYRYKKEAQYPVLEKIIRGFADAAAERVRQMTGCACHLRTVRCAKAPFDVWLRLKEPVSVSFSVYPLEGTGVFGMDEELAAALNHSCFSSGSYASLSEQRRERAGAEGALLFQPVGKHVTRHFLHLFLLDLEWALAPYYEVEVFGSPAHEQVAYSKHFWLDDPCVVCELAVELETGAAHTHDRAAVTGSMLVVFPEKMLAPIAAIINGIQEIVVPERTKIDRAAVDSCKMLPDVELVSMLMAQPPLSAAVLLSELPEDRREQVLAMMPEIQQKAISRRLGHRARIEHVLTEPQQFVASVLALGERHAAQVLQGFAPEAAAGFLREASKLPSLYAEQVTELLQCQNTTIGSAGALFVDSALVRRLMIRAIAPEHMHQVVSLCRNNRIYMPFALVASEPAMRVAALLQDEPVALQSAVVLLLLATDREYAARLLRAFPRAERDRIAEHLRCEKTIAPELITVLESALLRQVAADAGKELLAISQGERWAVSGTVAWLLAQDSE